MKREVTKPIGLLLVFVIMFLHVLFHKMIELRQDPLDLSFWSF